jgi:hypothetical protein
VTSLKSPREASDSPRSSGHRSQPTRAKIARMVPVTTPPLAASRPEALSRGGHGLPAGPRPAPTPALPVLQRQRAPQQLALDLRRR